MNLVVVASKTIDPKLVVGGMELRLKGLKTDEEERVAKKQVDPRKSSVFIGRSKFCIEGYFVIHALIQTSQINFVLSCDDTFCGSS